MTALSASRLGVWQFLADMPFDSISLCITWKIFWNIYCKETSGKSVTTMTGCPDNTSSNEAEPAVLSPDSSPSCIAEIQEAMKG